MIDYSRLSKPALNYFEATGIRTHAELMQRIELVTDEVLYFGHIMSDVHSSEWADMPAIAAEMHKENKTELEFLLSYNMPLVIDELTNI